MTLLRHEPSPVSVTAIDDLQVLSIHHETIDQFFQRNPKFAMAMNDFVEKRRKAIREVTGTEADVDGLSARHRWMETWRDSHNEALQETQEG